VKEILAVVRRCGFTVAHVDYTTNNFIFVLDRLVVEVRASSQVAGEPR
jgi:hypothetical protein